MALDPTPAIARFLPHADPRSFVPLGNHGGFSGACLWRGRSAGAELALRAWPSGQTADRLARIHTLQNRTGLPFVPRAWATPTGDTVVAAGGRVWDLCDWLPGRADFRDDPSDDRLAAAVTALARLHDAWAPPAPTVAPCPAVRRRLVALEEWHRLLASGWRPDFGADAVASSAWRLLPGVLADLPTRLAAWADRPVPVQPCLCDVWHDHVLFTGAAITGVIDYGAVKTDAVAVDLARLLGSFLGGARSRRAWAVARYEEVRPLGTPAELIDLLDASGVALGAANWLRWLYHERRPFEDRAAVGRRLAELVGRLEREGRP